jgi:hypothetical protein
MIKQIQSDEMPLASYLYHTIKPDSLKRVKDIAKLDGEKGRQYFSK